MTPQPQQPQPHAAQPQPHAARPPALRLTRVVIAEDSAILRDGLAHLLSDRGFEVIAAVSDAEQLREAVRADPPDVCVVDIRMPPTFTDEGLRAAIELRRSHPQVGILVFSQYVETHYATELLAEGAQGVGYLLKDRVADVREFVEALQRVAAGGSALDPEVVSQFLAASRKTDALGALTPRERDVLTAMAEGLSNSGIAAALVITERAVEKHVANILAKFDLPPSDTENRRVMAVLRYLDS
jgi:DNA-binding NarL/FixJ family response regulator